MTVFVHDPCFLSYQILQIYHHNYPMTLNNYLLFRNECILSGVWCALTHKGRDVTSRVFTKEIVFDDQKMRVDIPRDAVSWLLNTGITADALALYAGHTSLEPRCTLQLLQGIKEVITFTAGHTTVEGFIEFDSGFD